MKAIDVGMGLVIEIDEGAGGNEVFAAALAVGKEERDVRDLFGEDGGGAVHPGDLFVGIEQGEIVVTGGAVVAAEPGGGG